MDDSLALIVDGAPAFYKTQYITEGGRVRERSDLYAPCGGSTLVPYTTWGRLKMRYR